MNSEQLTLAFPPRVRDLQATFAEGPSNFTARKALDQWRHWPSGAMALVGPPACGKSHMAAIWAGTHGGGVVSAAQWSQTPEDVVDAYRDKTLVLEDADSDSVHSGAALYTLLNAAREGQIAAALITARTRPSQWCKGYTSKAAASADLMSRLDNLPTLEVTDPDDEELEKLLLKLFIDRGVNVSSAVVAYLLRRMERSHAAAVALVEALDTRALAQNAKITTRLAASYFDTTNNEPE